MKYVIDTDRFIPEIKELFVFGLCDDDTITTPSNIRHIGEPLNSKYVNEHFKDLHEGEYEVAYKKGLEDAWGMARELVFKTSLAEFAIRIDPQVRSK